jgi:hypothetical protein
VLSSRNSVIMYFLSLFLLVSSGLKFLQGCLRSYCDESSGSSHDEVLHLVPQDSRGGRGVSRPRCAWDEASDAP